MATIICETGSIHIPSAVVDLHSFRRWVQSTEAPEKGSIHFLQDDVWVDLSREEIFTHNQVKGAVLVGIAGLVKRAGLGLYLSSGARLTNLTAGISVLPDGMFIANETIRAERVRFVDWTGHGPSEVEGTPDLVVEIVSDSSVEKDTEWLMRAYWEAGIREYWLIDAREESLRFDVWRHGSKGYVLTRKQAGRVKSVVLGMAFRLTRQEDELGLPDFTLVVR